MLKNNIKNGIEKTHKQNCLCVLSLLEFSL